VTRYEECAGGVLDIMGCSRKLIHEVVSSVVDCGARFSFRSLTFFFFLSFFWFNKSLSFTVIESNETGLNTTLI